MRNKIRIEFDQDLQDALAFHEEYIKHSKDFKRLRIYISLLAPIIGLVSVLNRYFKEGIFDPYSVIAYGIISVLGAYLIPKYIAFRTLRRTRRMYEEGDNSSLLSKTILEFSDEGISATKRDSQSTIQWSGIQKFVERENYYFLYTSSVNAIVIPKAKAGFDSESKKEFDTLLENKSLRIV
ncbi:YcxB family protein [Leptospira sarikeiensis]|uniref:YcxB family protein n=1 Tax=Leptospira sarikeiensis TaxID=2484943 RepID=A0A4R9KAH0_9LEPT|nr:YcxB family protein [Leptospira sarikeiensis]TGL63718.1 YcxB family protein [Leptospira sarikeiensis]